jgi:hypothetical protein
VTLLIVGYCWNNSMDVVRQQVTVDELLLLPDGFSYEFVKGELRRMTPAGNVHGCVAMNRDVPKLRFSVREPFVSKATAAGIVWGNVRAGDKLEVVSQMPQDGVEADYLSFDSDSVATISITDKRARLVAAWRWQASQAVVTSD